MEEQTKERAEEKTANGKAKKGLLPALLLLLILFLMSFGIQDVLILGWYQQWLPDLNGSTIKDITFLDSLTGFAVTNSNSQLQQYILKTTNCGDNWFINYTFNTPNSNWYFFKIQFLNQNTGFAFSWTEMFKTTNRGENWSQMNYDIGCGDFWAVNEDTIIAVNPGGFGGGVYRTTDGGSNWQLIWTNGASGNPDRIYMVNKDMGFHCDFSSSFYTRRTTNGGLNWVNINEDSFAGIGFYDTLIGWKGDINGIKKTTNGGLNWFTQSHAWVTYFNCLDIAVINADTTWFVGSYIYTNLYRGVIFRTTNGGDTWGFQLPDTSIHIMGYAKVRFTNKNNGWAYRYGTVGVHTNTGGNDTTYYTAVNNQAVIVPEQYILFQNYPNPFNQLTIIKYQLSIRAVIKLSIYDINGREIDVLINKTQSPGVYDVRFDTGNLTSGVYFYLLYADGRRVDTKRMLLVK